MEKDIAYQNKDISSKFVAENYGNTLFELCGLDIPRLVKSEPTELPAIEVSSMFMDRLFVLEDGSYAIIDFESVYKEDNKVKYLGYLARLVKRLYNQDKKMPDVRIVIIYTADVKPGTTNNVIDLGQNKLEIKESFLIGWDTERIFERISGRAESGEILTDKELLQLMLLPLTVIGDEEKLHWIRNVIELLKSIRDDQALQLAAGVLAFSDKVLSENESKDLLRRISMTKVGRLIIEQEEEAIRKAEERIARNYLIDGDSPERVSRMTGLDITVVRRIMDEIQGKLVTA